MVEKGTYTKAADLTTLEKDAYDNLYERGGLLMATEDGGAAPSLSVSFYEMSGHVKIERR